MVLADIKKCRLKQKIYGGLTTTQSKDILWIYKRGETMSNTIQTTIKPWGNSQGIRIPKEILRSLGLAVHEPVDLSIEEDRMIITKRVARKTLAEYAVPYGGKLGPYEEFDFGEGIGISRWLDEET